MTDVKLGTRLALALSLATAVVVAACTDDGRPCYPQDYRACACPPGTAAAAASTHGFQQCTADGQGYGACDCSGAVPGVTAAPDAGALDAASEGAPVASEAGDASALLPFMSACETNEQCDTGLCFNFNAKGRHCSKPCTQASECPPPSGGCSNMSVCKAP